MLRKRNAWVKKQLPGGTMPWIRAHLYLPILALIAAFVHATIVPFRLEMTSGKALLVVGILVSIAGVARHHLIGVQKTALNVNVAISKLSTGQPRAFRRLVADFTDTDRPVAEIDAEMAAFPPDLQAKWAEIKELRTKVDKHFPRSGGQRLNVRSYKVWRALHPPLTILLFALLAFHMWDVLGGNTKFFQDDKAKFVAASTCADCHSREYNEWAQSAMTHAQTSTITEAQLPVTLAKNRELADDAQKNNDGDSACEQPGREPDRGQPERPVRADCQGVHDLPRAGRRAVRAQSRRVVTVRQPEQRGREGRTVSRCREEAAPCSPTGWAARRVMARRNRRPRWRPPPAT